MATIAASLPVARTIRMRPVLAVVALCLASASLYAWMRVPAAGDLHAQSLRWCGDLLLPSDPPCRLPFTLTLTSYVGGSLLTGLALALPGVVLAAAGRRLTAVGPVLLAAGAVLLNAFVAPDGGGDLLFGLSESAFGSGEAASYWAAHAGLAAAADALLVCVPALAVAFLLQPPRRPRPRPLPRHAAWMATFTIGAAISVLHLMSSRAPSEYVASPAEDPWIAIGFVALFGAMLGTDRRWWPWTLAPVAVLLSLGPSMAVMAMPARFTALTWFASVVPLAATTFLASLWRPLAERYAGRHLDAGTKVVTPIAAQTPASTSRRVRPVVPLNALAAGMLLLSLVATRTDPLRIQLATSLPTFLGVRELAQDVRTKTNLAEAIGAMEGYRAEHGTYVGFDASVAERAVPELAWSDGPSAEELVVRITRASSTTAQVVARSGSRNAYCVQVSGGITTLGEARRGDVAAARAACGAAPFTTDELRMLDVETFCADIDDSAIVMCRSLQRLLRETLATPAPA